MRVASLLGTAAVRLALVFAAIFMAGVFLMLVALQWSIQRYAGQSTDDALRTEMALFQGESAHGGSASLALGLRARDLAIGARPFFYRVVTPAGQVYAANLPPAPGLDGFSQIAIPAPPEAREFQTETMTVRTLTARAADGWMLTVGRDTYALDELNEWMGQLTLWGGLGLTLMAIAGGLLVGRLFLSRLDKVNSAAERIMTDELSERLPSIGFGAEFDRLTASLNRMLDRLAGSMNGLRQISTDIAHDLRTPLGHMRQRLERAVARAADVDECKAALNMALDDIDEVLTIFSSLLRIAQLEGGAGREQFKAIDLPAVLDRVANAFSPTAEDRGQTIETSIAQGLVADGDAILLGQLFSNVLENAIIHSPPGSRILLQATLDEGSVAVVVADNGPGVPRAEFGRIAQRFYRLDRSRSTPGSGLGLAMATAIAEMHGADLEFEDNRPGLRVTFRIPSAAPACRGHPKADRSEGGRPATEQKVSAALITHRTNTTPTLIPP